MELREMLTWAALVLAAVGLLISVRSVVTKHIAERNLQLKLEGDTEREALAEQILLNPNTENIQKGRELIINAMDSMSRRDRREIASGLNQDTVGGRARYVAKVITGGRDGRIRQIPVDERITG